MEEAPIYLDYNATTPVAPAVLEAMEPYFAEEFGNPSSLHRYGERAARAVDRARTELADALDASEGSIYFTGSGTESNNLAICGAVSSMEGPVRVAISAVEHPSVVETCRYLETVGVEVARIGVGDGGRVDLSELERVLRDGVDLVSVMHANNEVGSIQPIADVSKLAHEYGAIVHTDAAQTVGKIDVSVDQLEVDLLTVAGHKVYAPKGIGALYVDEEVTLEPVLRGGGQEGGVRPSTENVPYIVGLSRAVGRAVENVEQRADRFRSLRERLVQGLREADVPLRRHGDPEGTLPNTLNCRFGRIPGREILSRADSVAASTGSACHEAGAVEPSSVLRAMGLGRQAALGGLRFSVGEGTDCDDIDRATAALARAYRGS